jgi:5'-nucleotidase
MRINWNNIDTVLLDMDGTLLDLHFDNFFWLNYLPKRYAEIHNIPFKTANDQIHNLSIKTTGTLNWYSTTYWSKELSVDIYRLKKEISGLIKMRPFAQEFLEQLGLHKKKRVLVTNAHPQSLELKISVTQINSLLDNIYTSHQFHHPKESQKFWYAFACQEKFDPEKTLFIDDSVNILQAASHYGIKELLGIKKPDGSQNSVEIEGFASIASFNEILPLA